jgi:hypothetical protein
MSTPSGAFPHFGPPPAGLGNGGLGGGTARGSTNTKNRQRGPSSSPDPFADFEGSAPNPDLNLNPDQKEEGVSTLMARLKSMLVPGEQAGLPLPSKNKKKPARGEEKQIPPEKKFLALALERQGDTSRTITTSFRTNYLHQNPYSTTREDQKPLSAATGIAKRSPDPYADFFIGRAPPDYSDLDFNADQKEEEKSARRSRFAPFQEETGERGRENESTKEEILGDEARTTG